MLIQHCAILIVLVRAAFRKNIREVFCLETKVEELQRVIIKEELMALVETYYGNKQGIHMRAAYLNNMIFWQGIRMKSAKTELNKIERAIKNKVAPAKIEKMKKAFRGNWFYKTSEEQMDELMGFCSPSSVTRMNKEFEKQGWMEVGNNPDPKKKWDKATWYKLDLVKINSDLNKLGYHLDSFKFEEVEQTPENSIFHGENSEAEPFVEGEQENEEHGESPESSIFHGENSNFHDESSNFHGESSTFHGENSNFHDGRTIPEGFSEGFTEGVYQNVSHNSSSSYSGNNVVSMETKKTKADDDERFNLLYENGYFQSTTDLLEEYGLSNKNIHMDCLRYVHKNQQRTLYERPTREAIEKIINYVKDGGKYSNLGSLLGKEIIQSHQRILGELTLRDKERHEQEEYNKKVPFYNWLEQ
jgi:hypothetical protein